MRWDAAGVARRVREQQAGGALALARRVLDDSARYVPEETGALRASGAARAVGEGRAQVVWDRPYARRVYGGVAESGRALGISTARNPLARARWFEHAKSEQRGWQQAARQLLGGKE